MLQTRLGSELKSDFSQDRPLTNNVKKKIDIFTRDDCGVPKLIETMKF